MEDRQRVRRLLDALSPAELYFTKVLVLKMSNQREMPICIKELCDGIWVSRSGALSCMKILYATGMIDYKNRGNRGGVVSIPHMGMWNMMKTMLKERYIHE